jgi:predicted nuclease of predicted toxin-antitoxin system
MMKFKTDENMPVEAADDLRQAGHDAATVGDQQLAGQPDVRIADVSNLRHRPKATRVTSGEDAQPSPLDNGDSE